jgi:hypothetical protein
LPLIGPDASHLGRKVHDEIRPLLREERTRGRGIGEVERRGTRSRYGASAATPQLFHDMAPQKATSACHENLDVG